MQRAKKDKRIKPLGQLFLYTLRQNGINGKKYFLIEKLLLGP